MNTNRNQCDGNLNTHQIFHLIFGRKYVKFKQVSRKNKNKIKSNEDELQSTKTMETNSNKLDVNGKETSQSSGKAWRVRDVCDTSKMLRI